MAVLYSEVDSIKSVVSQAFHIVEHRCQGDSCSSRQCIYSTIIALFQAPFCIGQRYMDGEKLHLYSPLQLGSLALSESFNNTSLSWTVAIYPVGAVIIVCDYKLLCNSHRQLCHILYEYMYNSYENKPNNVCCVVFLVRFMA